MRNLTDKEVSAVRKVGDKFRHAGHNIGLVEWTNGEILELIRYCKKLSKKLSKKLKKNITMLLSDPKDPRGYSNEEINKILKDNNLNVERFWKAFGICTCLITTNGEYRYYKCDVERALYKLGSKLGKDHLWD